MTEDLWIRAGERRASHRCFCQPFGNSRSGQGSHDMRRLIVLLLGVVVGGLLMYGAFQYHLV
ncbi:MAG TPA: hypothetical protein VHB77_19575, partial [Planctomycetaceae bacterium]|nr:hypothetical protein [Planctomycetaceae bacterium]